MKIVVEYPEKIYEKNKVIFRDLLSYSVRVPKIKRKKNAFISHEGLVLSNFLLEARSGFNLRGTDDINFYFTYWKNLLEQYIVCKFGKSLISKKFDTHKYSIVHTKWFNYGFWINDSINRCILLEETKESNLTILIPESIYNVSFVKETLDVFDFKIEILPKDTHCFIKNLLLPETRENTAQFDPISINRIRNKMLPISLIKSKVFEFPDKIYLTRKERGVRCVKNEFEIENILTKLGFIVLSFENISIWDQISYMSHASWFISNHGAGFSNIIFMKPGSKVMEFIEYDFAHYGNPFPHWRLANILNLKYHFMLGDADETEYIEYLANAKTNSKKRMELVNREITINVNELQKILNE
jgi:capsular polysaccharide biosynthesis protein